MMDRLARRLRTARIGAPTPGIAGTADDTLEAFDVTVHFEGLAAVDGVSISMRNGEVLGSSAPTAPARRRSSTCLPASSVLRAGGSSWAATM